MRKVVDFDVRRGLVQHVGMRGHTSVKTFDPDRARRLFRRYLGPEQRWDGRFHGVFDRAERYRFVRFDPRPSSRAISPTRQHSYNVLRESRSISVDSDG